MKKHDIFNFHMMEAFLTTYIKVGENMKKHDIFHFHSYLWVSKGERAWARKLHCRNKHLQWNLCQQSGPNCICICDCISVCICICICACICISIFNFRKPGRLWWEWYLSPGWVDVGFNGWGGEDDLWEKLLWPKGKNREEGKYTNIYMGGITDDINIQI